MSLWNCLTCGALRGPSPDNRCPTCGSAMHWTTVVMQQPDPARVQSVEPAQEIGSATKTSSSSTCLICLRLEGERDHWRDLHAVASKNAGELFMEAFAARQKLADAQAQLAGLERQLRAEADDAARRGYPEASTAYHVSANMVAALSPDPLPPQTTDP